MLQLLFVLFLAIAYSVLRHVFRNRRTYLNLYRMFSNPGTSGQTRSDVREKKIITCPYCGSNPEVTNEPCSSCGRRL